MTLKEYLDQNKNQPGFYEKLTESMHRGTMEE